MKTYAQHFAELFKNFRLSKNISQSQLAKRIGQKTNGYIANIEKGTSVPEDEMLESLADAMGVEVEELRKLRMKARLLEMGIHEENIFMDMLRVPLLGEVPCGNPKEAIEETDQYIPIPFDERLAKKKDLFALKANGLSMKDAGIVPGDMVLVDPYAEIKNRDIVIAMIREDTTMKYYYERGGYVELQPANDDFKPIKVDDPDFRIIGKVIRKVTFQNYE